MPQFCHIFRVVCTNWLEAQTETCLPFPQKQALCLAGFFAACFCPISYLLWCIYYLQYNWQTLVVNKDWVVPRMYHVCNGIFTFFQIYFIVNADGTISYDFYCLVDFYFFFICSLCYFFVDKRYAYICFDNYTDKFFSKGR